MGTDIHMIGEKWDRYDKKWDAFTIPRKFQQRYYGFFAVLGNVRNGSGFAGVYTHEPITPISDSRGIPKDAGVLVQKMIAEKLDEAPTGLTIEWLGDHSFTHVGLEELKDYEWPKTIQGGYMSLREYMDWDKVSRPESYCGDISGGKIEKIDESEVVGYDFDGGKDYYVQFRYEDHIVDPDFVKEFIEFLEDNKLCFEEDSDVRIVFGFDS